MSLAAADVEHELEHRHNLRPRLGPHPRNLSGRSERKVGEARGEPPLGQKPDIRVRSGLGEPSCTILAGSSSPVWPAALVLGTGGAAFAMSDGIYSPEDQRCDEEANDSANADTAQEGCQNATVYLENGDWEIVRVGTLQTPEGTFVHEIVADGDFDVSQIDPTQRARRCTSAPTTTSTRASTTAPRASATARATAAPSAS